MTAAIITMIVALALLVWVFLGVRVLYLRSRQPVSLVFLAIYLLTTLLVASYFILTDPGVSPWRLSAVEIRWFRFAIGLGVTASILIVLDNLLLKGYLVQQRGLYLPGPLRLAIHAAVLAIVVLLLLRTVLHINIVALVAVPTVLTAVIGFALKDTLARLFEGITLGRLMHIGDWVSLVGKEGRVANITLGYVTLQTRAGDYVMVPNNVVAQKEIINYSKPTREHVCCVTVEAAFADAPAKVIAVCQQAAAAVPGVLANPPPFVLVSAYRDSGIEYRVCFTLDDYAERYAIEGNVFSYIWYAFRREGIEIPYPAREMRSPPPGRETPAQRQADTRAGLARIDFLAGLSPAELDRLASSVERRVYMPGEKVVREGEAGEEYFYIVHGAVVVTVAGGAGTVATLAPGDYFGEMSLLTGAPRAATVTATAELHLLVLKPEPMRELLHANPGLAERIGETLVVRQSRLARAHAAAATPETTATTEKQKSRLVESIRRFLGRA